ncbi:MAG: glutathione peroxidase [Pseudomonadota bacterium]
MISLRSLILSLTALGALLALPSTAAANCPAVLDHDMKKLRSRESVNLCEAYAGKPVLVINTASHCGYTPQFKGLEALHQEYKDKGLVVAGFPSDSFNQEADSAEKTAEICYMNYGVTFDMYSEIPVKGSNAHPMFAQLAEAKGAPRWNFNKYLIDSDGAVVAKWGSNTTPDSDELRSAIESALAAE